MKTNHLLLFLAIALAPVSRVNATIQVRGAASAEGDTITVQLYADITSTPVISYSAKVFYDPKLLAVASASKNEARWHLSAGEGSVPYMDPDLSAPGEVLLVGAHWNATDPTAGVQGQGVGLGTVVFQRLGRATPEFGLAIGRGGHYASFVTTTGAVLESLPGEVAFEDVAAPRDDQDLDGLGDRWEKEHFGDISLAYHSDDSDKDGINEQGEESLGSDPNDPDSNLWLNLTQGKRSMVLEWTSFDGRSYTVESGQDCRKFEILETGIRATPPLNTLELKGSNGTGPTFYRVRLDPAGSDRSVK